MEEKIAYAKIGPSNSESNSFKIWYQTEIGTEMHVEEVDVQGAVICFIPKENGNRMGTAVIGNAQTIISIVQNLDGVGKRIGAHVKAMVREQLKKDHGSA